MRPQPTQRAVSGWQSLLCCLAATVPGLTHAQLPPAGLPPPRLPPPPPGHRVGPPAWASSLSGYWASLITENWRLRMLTPPKGDYVGVPLTAAAKSIADAWDPARDTAQGDQCKAYGAPAIMFRPEHLKIDWQQPEVLTIDIDDGTQVRTLHFTGAMAAGTAPTWQGYSAAAWVARGNGAVRAGSGGQYLQVVTTGLRPGYLRQNGIPYSARAVLHEAYDLISVSDRESYLVVTGSVTDPLYLDYPLALSATFEKQSDGSGWDPTPCSATW